MDTRTILMHLREGNPLDAEALRIFAMGLADGTVSDAQAGAFAMAVCTRGLGEAGRVALTRAMRDSGRVLRWELDRPILDKHSTGGVGDCVSLILAPALVACGAAVPMISGRGLGHSGGTLDKLEAIPGLNTQMDTAQLYKTVAEVGCAIVSASTEIAPADKRLYAVRDVSGTVESVDLITASILSKKLAAGLEGLVLDVKVGSGAFMKTAEDARELACSLVSTANAAGCPTTALITDMNQPLAKDMGNALEVASAIRVLTGQDQGRLREATVALGADLLANSGLFATRNQAARTLQTAITGGHAAEVFGRMILAQGGPGNFLERWSDMLPIAPVQRAVPSPARGRIGAWDGVSLGMIVVNLGGGRQVETDPVDPRVGLAQIAPLGAWVEPGDPIAVVHAATDDQAIQAVNYVQQALTISAKSPKIPDLVHERIT